MANRVMNRNPAYSVNYKLVIPGAEELVYGVQTTELPGMDMGGVETPFQKYAGSVPSNRIEYTPLNMTYLVDEDYENFNFIRLWMHKIVNTEPVITELKDMSLHILNSNKQTVRRVVFYGAYPISCAPVPLESSVGDAVPIVATALFKFQFYDFAPLT